MTTKNLAKLIIFGSNFRSQSAVRKLATFWLRLSDYFSNWRRLRLNDYIQIFENYGPTHRLFIESSTIWLKIFWSKMTLNSWKYARFLAIFHTRNRRIFVEKLVKINFWKFENFSTKWIQTFFEFLIQIVDKAPTFIEKYKFYQLSTTFTTDSPTPTIKKLTDCRLRLSDLSWNSDRLPTTDFFIRTDLVSDFWSSW